MLRKNNFLVIGLLSVLFISCDKNRVFDGYQEIDGSWHKDEQVSFTFDQNDTITNYNMYVNIRNNNNYPFNNLFLIVSMLQPDGITKVDTLEYQMAKEDGTLLGDGFSDIKESKLWYKENTKFPKIGKYTVSIQQAVRETGKIGGMEQLQGVSEVGFRIEKAE